MKKILILLCAILWGIGAEAQRLRSADTTTDDLKQLLAEAGYQTHAFDLTDFLSKTYHVQLQIREYIAGEQVKTLTWDFENRMMVTDFSKEEQQEIKRLGIAYNFKKGILAQADRLVLQLIPTKCDSLRTLSMNLPNMGTSHARLQLRPISDGKSSYYNYAMRPFQLKEFREGEFTPLLFYGSYWFDARANRFRFCGEKQIAPDLSSEIVERVPHFFVIGVQMTPME